MMLFMLFYEDLMDSNLVRCDPAFLVMEMDVLDSTYPDE